MATMMDVMRYFEYDGAAKFRMDWNALSDQDKDDLKGGMETLNY